LDAYEVRKTRTYAGQIMLPGWVSAFGWPLLLVLTGVAIIIASHFASGGTVMRVPLGLIGVGVGWFFVKLMTDGEA
jgi:hypothetical protein